MDMGNQWGRGRRSRTVGVGSQQWGGEGGDRRAGGNAASSEVRKAI